MATQRDDAAAAPGADGAPLVAGSSRFQTTEWSLVCSARDATDTVRLDALERLCRRYWYPLYAYVRRRGYSVEDAQDLTQGFFSRLLAKDYLLAADEAKGKFRTFLLLAMKRFLANEWHRAGAQKRGGGKVHIPIDQGWAEETYHHEPADDVTPEILYERRWALLLLGHALEAVRADMVRHGREALFEALKDGLADGQRTRTYAEVGRELGLSESAVKAAAHRMRVHFRDELRAAIRDTVESADDVEAEIQHLFSVF